MIIGIDTFSDLVQENNNINNNSKITLSNIIVSEFNIVNAIKSGDDYVYPVPNINELNNIKWEDNTVVLARYNHSLDYGAIDLGGYQMQYIYVQRKLLTDTNWQTFYVKGDDGDNNLITIVDKFIQNDSNYQYRIVPVSFIKQGEETTEILGVPSNVVSVDTFGSSNYIYDKDVRYAFDYDFEMGDLTIVKPTSYVEPLSSKYPTVFVNGNTQYTKGSLSCKLITDYSKYGNVNVVEEYKNRMAVANWLSNGKPKILKTMDGTFMIINIDGEVKLTPNNSLIGLYDVSFNFTEIGDALDANTLQELGLIANDEINTESDGD